MFCPLCGPLHCLEVKYYHQDMTKNISEPCYFTNWEKKRKKKQKKTAATHAKISKIHPRKTSVHWRKSGREAQAPLGTQPEGVSYLSGTCSVSLYSGPLPQEWRQSLTDQPSHCFFLLCGGTWNQQQGEKTKCSASFSFEGLGAGVGILTSTAEHRETWSSQQYVINVTSSVGTRGSSTVHSDSSGEEKSEFLSHQKKASSQSLVDLASSSWTNVACGFTKELNITDMLGTMIDYLTKCLIYIKTAAESLNTEWCGKSLVLGVTENRIIRMRSTELVASPPIPTEGVKDKGHHKGVHYNRNPQKTTRTRSVLYGYT